MKFRIAVGLQQYPIQLDDNNTLSHGVRKLLKNHSPPSLPPNPNPDDYVLVSDMTRMPLSMNVPLALSGANSNALLRLEYSKRKNSPSFDISVAIQHPDGERLTGNFPSSYTLWDVLSSLNTEEMNVTNSLGSDGKLLLPVLVYQRARYDTLHLLCSTSLRDLDLGRNGVLFRLHFKESEIEILDLPRLISMYSPSPEPLYAEKFGLTESTRTKDILDNDIDTEMKKMDVDMPRVHFGRIERYLYYLGSEIDDDDMKISVFRLLFKIIKNIVDSPDETKFRTLDTNSSLFQKRLSSFENSLGFLEAIGFDLQETTLAMDDENIFSDTLKRTMQSIQKTIECLKNKKQKLDSPIASLVESLRNPEESVPPVEVDPHEHLVIFQEPDKSGTEWWKELDEYQVEEDPYDSVLVRQAAASAKKQSEKSSLLMPQSTIQRQKKAELLQKFSSTKVRFKFSDKLIIQTRFNSKSSIKSVFQFLKSLMNDSSKKFDLKVPPNLLYNGSESSSLEKESLIPTVAFLVCNPSTGEKFAASNLIQNSYITNIVPNPDLENHLLELERMKEQVAESLASESKPKKKNFSKFIKL